MNNISFTAEAVALMRDKEGDKYSKYFITNRIKILYSIINSIIPKKLMNNIVKKRMHLANKIEQLIKREKPLQIIELASGYSTKGLNFTKHNSKITYIELDLKEIIENKQRILEKNKINHKNLSFIQLDIIKNDIYSNIKTKIDTENKTVIFSEGFNQYLTREQHDKLTTNINNLFKEVKNIIYISHDTLQNNENAIFSGKIGKILKFLHRSKTDSSNNKHFNNEKELLEYFKKKISKNFKIIERGAFTIYEVSK